MNTQISNNIKTKAIRKKSVRNKEKDRLNRNILAWAKKIKAVQYKGGKCSCGEANPLVLSFHHNCGNKEKSINSLKKARWEDIRKEIDKCILVCENCHREIHYTDIDSSHDSKIRRANKQLCLEFVNEQCCRCGYVKCNGALDFHHIDANEKEFGIAKKLGRKKAQTVYDLKKGIAEELEKCDVYCVNCHKIIHDKGFYEKHKIEIFNKLETMKDKNKVDSELVFSLRKQGLSPKEIATRCGYSYIRVYEILRANGIQETRSIENKALIIQLGEEGYSYSEIAKRAGCSYGGVKYILETRKNNSRYGRGLKGKQSCESLAS